MVCLMIISTLAAHSKTGILNGLIIRIRLYLLTGLP